MPRTQEERRAETRRRLLDAAREVVADRGVAGASVDALAEAADRTSGALYDHFGGKEGLILALLDEWKEATAAATVSDLSATDDAGERLRHVWQRFASPPSDGGEQWTLLEHELWLYACRQAELRPAVAARYDGIRRTLAAALAAGLLPEAPPPPEESCQDVATLVIALMIGLEMQRRLDEDAVSDDLAVAGLRALMSLS